MKCKFCHFSASCTRKDDCARCLRRHVQTTHDHIKRHRGIRSSPCTFCNYSAFSRSEKNKHVNSRHDHIKPYTCSVCSFQFDRQENLKKHLRYVHKIYHSYPSLAAN